MLTSHFTTGKESRNEKTLRVQNRNYKFKLLSRRSNITVLSS